jgi:hypothetical protein
MTDRDDYLRNVTYKGGNFDVAKRVFTTLLNVGEDGRARALAWLVTRLHTEGKLSNDDLDDLLYATKKDA